MVIIIFVNAFYNYDEYRGNGEGKKKEEEKKVMIIASLFIIISHH